MANTDDIDALILLANNKPRKVASAEGEKKFGQPVGSIIVPDVDKASAKTTAKAEPTKSGKQAIGKAQSAGKKPLTVVESSLKGNKKFTVGGTTYSAPSGSRLIRPKKNSADLAYVVTPDGELHALVASGEVEMPKALSKVLAKRFEGDLESDAKYDEAEFDADPETDSKGEDAEKKISLAEMEPGSVLLDDEGEVQFRKNEAGDWIHADFGVEVDEDDLQPLYDEGELTYSDTDPEADAEEPEAEADAPEEESLDEEPPAEEESLDEEPPAEEPAADEAAPEIPVEAEATEPPTGTLPDPGKSEPTPRPTTDGTPPAEYSAEATANQIHSASLGDRVFIRFNTIGMGTEYERGVDGRWQSLLDPNEDLGTLTVSIMASDGDTHTVYWSENNVSKGGEEESGEGLADWEVELLKPFNDTSDESPATPFADHTYGDVLDALNIAPVGSTIVYDNDQGSAPITLQKNAKGRWGWTGQSDWGWDNERTSEQMANLHEYITEFTEGSGSDDSGPLDLETLANAPVGTAVTNSQGQLLVKVGDDKWALPSTTDFPRYMDTNDVRDMEVLPFDGVAPAVADLTPSIPEGAVAFSPKKSFSDMVIGDKFYAKIGNVTYKYEKITEEGIRVTPPDGEFFIQYPDELDPDLIFHKGAVEYIVPEGASEFDPTKEWDSLEVGDKFYTEFKGVKAEFTKTSDTGMQTVTEAGGTTFKNEHTYDQFDFTKNEFYVLPKTTAQAETSSYAYGDTIKKFGHLREMPEGTTLELLWPGEDDGFTQIADFRETIVKQADGTWKSTDPDADDTAVSWNMLAESIMQGHLSYRDLSKPSANSTTKDIQLAPSVPAFTPAEAQEALDALQDHTGFQLAYGLKSVPNNPVVPHIDAIKTAALEKYPALKPKAAVVKLLQEKLGITTEVKSDPMLAGAKVWLGSKTPKLGVQGLDGGEFSLADIADAIKILEEFNGKAFKAELNKKGNSLGTLNPNDLVGFNKDKTVTKQKFIDLLKTKLGTTSKEVKNPTIKDKDQLLSLPVGAVVEWNGKEKYRRLNDAQWTMVDDSGEPVPDTVTETMTLATYSEDGSLRIVSVPDTTPDYAKVPEAVEDKIVTEADVAAFGPDDVQGASAGTILIDSDGYYVTKVDSESWETVDPATGSAVAVSANFSISSGWEAKGLRLYGPMGPSVNSHGLVPGKYVSSGNAYMVVNANGTGVYVNAKGEVKQITANAVKSNFDKGMNKFSGVPDDMPEVTAPATKTKAKASVAKVEDLPDGKYFSGDLPNMNNATVYEVNGKDVQVFKPKVTLAGTKVGKQPNVSWMEEALVGARIRKTISYYTSVILYNEEGSTYSVSLPTKDTLLTFTKGEDGLWHSNLPDLIPTPQKSIPYLYNYVVESHGVPVPTKSTKTTLNKSFMQGKLLDEFGTSIIPDGYSGGIYFFGRPTTIPELIAARKALDATEFAGVNDLAQAMVNHGVKFENTLVKRSLGIEMSAGVSVEAAHTLFTSKIDALLEKLDTDLPENEAADLFEWDDLGNARSPVEVAAHGHVAYWSDNTTLTDFIKLAGNHFGGGGVVGQHYTKMAKSDKSSWVSAWNMGDFKTMYNIEVAAATKAGVPHAGGTKHPGHPSNPATHKVTWGAAVSGEVPAGEPVEGDWSSASITMPDAEVDNYLIKAQMQAPEYLTPIERRQWVKLHRNSDTSGVNKLSATAAMRKKQGVTPKTDKPFWTEGLKPAKSYDALFDNGEYPNPQDFNGTSASEWFNEHSENNSYLAEVMVSQVEASAIKRTELSYAEFDALPVGSAIYMHHISGSKKLLYKTTAGTWLGDSKNVDAAEYKAAIEDGSQTPWMTAIAADLTPVHSMYKLPAVREYFQSLEGMKADYEAVPVYTKIKEITGSTHPVWVVQDQFGTKSIFKPTDSTEQRSRIEAKANELARFWGYSAAQTEMTTILGQPGLRQSFVDSVSSFNVNGKDIDLSTLTPKQLAQVAQEHVLDWMLDNDDTHSENLLIRHDGGITGIDKGRAFYMYGRWDGLSTDGKANTQANLVYTKMYDAIRSGKLSQEQIDAAYFGAIKSSQRIQKANWDRAEALVREGLEGRTKWPADKNLPQSADEMIAAIKARRDSLADDIKAMWEKVYADSGLEVPTAPAKRLGDNLLSGWDEADLMDKVAQAKVWGAATAHASADILGGHSILWAEKTMDGKDVTKGQFRIGKFAQKKILEFLKPRVSATPTYGVNANAPILLNGFPDTSDWKKVFTTAGKHITKHAVEKNYGDDGGQEILDNFTNLKNTIAADFDHWNMDLLPPVGEDEITFPSGRKVNPAHLLQYRQMLDHYRTMAAMVTKAWDTDTPTYKDDFKAFQPIAFKAKPIALQSPEGVVYKELSNGKYLSSEGQIMNSAPVEMDDIPSDWTLLEGEEPMTGPVYVFRSAHAQRGTLEEGGILTETQYTHQGGQQGQEYEITLTTGEVITFRNADTTSTARSQHGRFTFRLNPDSDPASSLQNVNDQLELMGMDMSGAEESDAETTYWREMFARLYSSNVSGASAEVKHARKVMEHRAGNHPEYMGNSWEAINAISDSMEAGEEAAFWRDLAEETWGAGKVSEWISAGNHLPQFRHMNMADPESNTGKPFFKRIDVDVEQLMDQKTFVAVGSKGKDDSNLRYLTTGGMLSTEERIRVLGWYKEGISSDSDQGYGSANGVFARIAKPGTESEWKGSAGFGHHTVYLNPNVMAETGTYSYEGDKYGDLDHLTSANKYNPVHSLQQNGSIENETLIQNSISILDNLEILVFEDIQKRLEAITRMKELGFDMLRGLPIEDRFVLRVDLKKAMDKARTIWK